MLPPEGITVSEFIDVFNQTIDYAYPGVAIIGELANFRVSKNRWLYFDLKDENSSLKFFGTVYHITQPLEEGMLLKVNCTPKLHNSYGFSMQLQSIELVGEGSIKRAAQITQEKLAKEGLFDESRKRRIPYPPTKIGLITSAQSAAYADFMKIIDARWPGLEIVLADVQVQGEPAVEQIISAINSLNNYNIELETIVIIRGGGSPEDLAAFNNEALTRAVAASNIPTLVAIGHEIDICLAELASDRRASTPSNAAELLVPDQKSILESLKFSKNLLSKLTIEATNNSLENLASKKNILANLVGGIIEDRFKLLQNRRELLDAYNPQGVLNRGFSIIKKSGKLIRSTSGLSAGDILDIRLSDGEVTSQVKGVKLLNKKLRKTA
ncbi:MAG TPA: exodeoxyribonuclease VII large subunit [Candidatus Saccharimonadales bacterium]